MYTPEPICYMKSRCAFCAHCGCIIIDGKPMAPLFAFVLDLLMYAHTHTRTQITYACEYRVSCDTHFIYAYYILMCGREYDILYVCGRFASHGPAFDFDKSITNMISVNNQKN